MSFLANRLVAAIGGALACAAFARAEATATSTHARLTLLSSESSIEAGKPFTVALHFELDPAWHVYWKDPGDSGMPPSVKWTLPDGFTASELKWPKPEVLTTPAGVNYVYHGDVALLVTITPPADLKVGASVPIAATVSWLECDKNQCLAAKASVSTSLNVATTSVTNEADPFTAWQAKVAEGESFDPATAK